MTSFDAQSIANELQQQIQNNGLAELKCVAQTYDGAAVMSGTTGGVQAHFRRLHPEAIYMHCYAHELNLVLCHTCKAIPEAVELFSLLECVYSFVSTSLEAYTSSPLPPLGRSDHDLVQLLPVYKPLVHRQPASTHTKKIWSEESVETLKDCFDTTTIRVFANHKPWITPDNKTLLKEKRRVFKLGDRDQMKAVQRELRKKTREGKGSYRRRMEEQLQQKDVSGVWRSLKTISGHNSSRPVLDRDQERVNDLNRFFNRFEQPFSPPPTQPALLQSPPPTGTTAAPRTDTPTPLPAAPPQPPSPLTTPASSVALSTAQVERELSRLKVKKATGPDGISSRLLKPQFVRTQGCVSETVICSTGAPQGTVLVPLLFSIYTADFTHYTSNCHLQKFSDDSAIVGLINNGDEKEYRELNQNFVAWCRQNCLRINAGKTKELVVDFCRHKITPPSPVNIQGMDIKIVDSYKYLGVHLSKNLDWTVNTRALYKKGQSRLHLLRRLRSFGVQEGLLRTFYDLVVCGVVCWSSSITAAERKSLNKLVKKAGSVLGCSLDPVEVVGDRGMMTKLSSYMDITSHPLHGTVKALESAISARLLHPRCSKERYRRSFLPSAVRLYNQLCSQ
nr:PREDICTED: uncharacterized protein LOC103358552 [Stegastes partitus]